MHRNQEPTPDIEPLSPIDLAKYDDFWGPALDETVEQTAFEGKKEEVCRLLRAGANLKRAILGATRGNQIDVIFWLAYIMRKEGFFLIFNYSRSLQSQTYFEEYVNQYIKKADMDEWLLLELLECLAEIGDEKFISECLKYYCFGYTDRSVPLIFEQSLRNFHEEPHYHRKAAETARSIAQRNKHPSCVATINVWLSQVEAAHKYIETGVAKKDYLKRVFEIQKRFAIDFRHAYKAAVAANNLDVLRELLNLENPEPYADEENPIDTIVAFCCLMAVKYQKNDVITFLIEEYHFSRGDVAECCLKMGDYDLFQQYFHLNDFPSVYKAWSKVAQYLGRDGRTDLLLHFSDATGINLFKKREAISAALRKKQFTTVNECIKRGAPVKYILDPWCKDEDKNGRMLTTLELLERAVYIENDNYIKALLEKCIWLDKDLKKVPQIRHIMKMSELNFIETVSCLEVSARIWLLQGTLSLPVEIYYEITSYVLGTNVDAIKFQLKFNTMMYNIFLKRFLNARFGGPDKWTQLKDESRDETIYTLADHSVVSKKSRHEHPYEHLTHYSNKLGLNLYSQVVSKVDTPSDDDVKFHKKLI